MLQFVNPIAAGTVLVRPALQSPNFVTGSAGWIVRADGTFELNGGVFRGGVLIGSATYIYSGTPAPGNLIESLGVAAAGTDPEGSAVLAGDTNYNFVLGGAAVLATQKTGGQIATWSAPTQAGPYTRLTTISFGTTDFVGYSGGVGIASGPLTATGGTAANPTEVQTDTWHPVPAASFGAGFAAGNPAPAYLLLPDRSVALSGQVSVTAVVASGAVMFTLPYTFSRPQGFTTPNSLSGATATGGTLEINANGTVTTRAAGGAGNVVFLDNCRNWLI